LKVEKGIPLYDEKGKNHTVGWETLIERLGFFFSFGAVGLFSPFGAAGLGPIQFIHASSRNCMLSLDV